MQANFSLPNFLIFFVDVKFLEVTNMEEWRTFSILLSFITISISIIKIWYNMNLLYNDRYDKILNVNLFSNKEKNDSLPLLNILVLVLRVLMDIVSRVLIFFSFMIVTNNGKFSPERTLISFYTMVGIMLIFNIYSNTAATTKLTFKA